MKWRARDFKGLAEGQLEFESGTLTVLAGANSSGKSSLLQSVLMAAQSLHHDGPIVLNGPLVRLGEAEDLVRDGAQTTRLSLQIGGQDGINLWDDPLTPASEAGAPGMLIEYELKSINDGGSLNLQTVRITSDLHGEDEPLLLSKENSRSEDVATVAQIVDDPDADILHVKTTLGSLGRQLRTYVAFAGLVPIALVRLAKSETVKSEYSTLFSTALKSITKEPSTSRQGSNRATLGSELFVLERELWRTAAILERDPDGDPTLKEHLQTLSTGSRRELADLVTLEPSSQQIFIDALARFRSKSAHVSLPIQSLSGRRYSYYASDSGILERDLRLKLDSSILALAGLRAALERLASQVQYLGPLRDEPRVVWTQWNEQALGLPVGARGELSAAVLSRRSSRLVSYVTPEKKAVRATLNSAVNDWLTYLEIGESVAAKSRGKLGVGVEVRVAGRARDLTSVGVGVSQALPLIVAYLSVPAHSIFFVEQPELHLHPAVQARLADFMLFARADVCGVVETHSEAFVTRIRRRVAEGGVRPQQVNIVFVENDGSGAKTRELKLSDYGDLSEWPSGFISGVGSDARAILQANFDRVQNR